MISKMVFHFEKMVSWFWKTWIRIDRWKKYKNRHVSWASQGRGFHNPFPGPLPVPSRLRAVRKNDSKCIGPPQKTHFFRKKTRPCLWYFGKFEKFSLGVSIWPMILMENRVCTESNISWKTVSSRIAYILSESVQTLFFRKYRESVFSKKTESDRVCTYYVQRCKDPECVF